MNDVKLLQSVFSSFKPLLLTIYLLGVAPSKYIDLFTMLEKKYIKGWTEKKLYDLEGNSVLIFQDNIFWKWIRRVFGVDIKMPFLTGYYTKRGVRHNLITDVGIRKISELIAGIDWDPVIAMAIGIGTPTVTALGSEINDSGGERVYVVPTIETTIITGDTIRYTVIFTFTGSKNVTEEGLFDSPYYNDGKMFASQSFSSIAVSSGFVLEIIHNIQISK